MANFTIELREILRSKDIFKAIEYDFYNNDYKSIFENKFIRHFYFREIGVETIQRFIYNLEQQINEIMPYYKQLYKTTTFVYDPIINYDMREELTRTIVGEERNTSSGSNDGESSSVNNEGINQYDTPITKNDSYKKHPSFVTEGNSSTTNTSTNNISQETNKNDTTNENNTLTRKGNIGVMTTQDMIIKERQIILNIDKMIIEELEILFMQIF